MTTTTDNVVELRPRSADADTHDADSDVERLPIAEMKVAETSSATLEQQLEALLLVSNAPLTVMELAHATGAEMDDIDELLVDLMTEKYNEQVSGIVLERVSGGWAFRAADATRDAMARLFDPRADAKLSPAAFETLAVVAYLQPISRPDVARIRGVSVDAAMSSLVDRGLVEEAGRADSGAVLFRTTALFERAFALPSLDSLPVLEGFGPGTEEQARLREQLERMADARVE